MKVKHLQGHQGEKEICREICEIRPMFLDAHRKPVLHRMSSGAGTGPLHGQISRSTGIPEVNPGSWRLQSRSKVGMSQVPAIAGRRTGAGIVAQQPCPLVAVCKGFEGVVELG